MTLRSKIVRGSLWVIAFRWIARFLGLINVAIIARILEPEDFGLVAMAMLVMGFVEIWLAFGLENACVQRKELHRAHLDTAWSMRLVQGLAVTLLVMAAAPLAARYFGDPRLTPLMLVLAGGILLGSAANIGVVLYRREMDFQSEFRLQLGARLVGFVCGLAAAVWLRNYWALAIGILSGIAATTVLSYLMHPFRPRWDLSHWRDLWSFSKWAFVVNIAQFADTRADEALVGRYGADELGLYAVASDLGQMPVNEIAAPVNRVLFPAFASVQAERDALRGAFLKALQAVIAVTWPAGVGLALVAQPAVALVLGAKWLAGAGVLAVIALFASVRSVAATGCSLLFGLGRPRAVASLAGVSFVAFIALALPLGAHAGLVGIAQAKLAAAVITAVASLWLVVRAGICSWSDLARVTWRPAVAVAIMAAVLTGLPVPDGLSPLVALAALCSIGAACYGAATLALWWASGRPEGPESLVLAALRRRWPYRSRP